MNNSEYTVRYNETLVEVSVHINSSVTVPSSWAEWGEIITTSPELRPKMPVIWHDGSARAQMKLTDNSTKISFKSVSNAPTPMTVYGMITYSRQ